MKHPNLLIFCLSLFMGFQSGFLMATTPEFDKEFSDKVNLALRQVGHKLLLQAGDDSSTIPPVEVIGIYSYALKLDHRFAYDTLPFLLNQALTSYHINEYYDLKIKDCSDSILILGYNYTAFLNKEVSCVDREQWSTCNQIFLSFGTPAEEIPQNKGLVFALILIIASLILGIGIFWRKSHLNASPISPDSHISLGNYIFDPQNQILILKEQQQPLTFRENKLLHFLASHANQVVTRDTLNEEVWGDEGVIVGRSLDVFISRLRKLLKGDETVLIKNIHGVGYRLEIKNPK